MVVEIIAISGPEDEPLLDAFYQGIYLEAFSHQREPVEVWKRRLWSGASAPYKLEIKLVGRRLREVDHREIHAGIIYERYPKTGCGLMTYMVVGRAYRRCGLGQQLIRGAVRSLQAGDRERYVFGEVSDPLHCRGDAAQLDEAWKRIELFQSWGARIVDARYIQPRLGEGLERDHALRLMIFPGDEPLPASVRGDVIAAFLTEFFAITEGASPDDPEVDQLLRGLDGPVRLVALE